MKRSKDDIVDEIAQIKREIPNVELFARLISDRNETTKMDSVKLMLEWERELRIARIRRYRIEVKIRDLRMDLMDIWSKEKRITPVSRWGNLEDDGELPVTGE